MLAAARCRAQPQRAGAARARRGCSDRSGCAAASAGECDGDRCRGWSRGATSLSDAGAACARLRRPLAPASCLKALAAAHGVRAPIVRAAAAAIGIAAGPAARHVGNPSDRRPEGTVHLRLVELNSSSGTNIPIERLEGLTAAQLTGAGGPVQFRLRRDAGTFTFEGVVRSGVGAGTFSFTPDPNFPRNWRSAALPGRRPASSTRWRGTTSGTRSWTS